MKPKKKINQAVAFSVAGILALAANVKAQTSDPALNALVKKGILTEQEAKDALADTERQKANGELTKTNKPFVMPFGNESSLKLGGFLQANAELGDAASFEGRFTGGPNQVNPRIRLRRARIGASGDLFRDFDFKLQGDFQQGDGLAPNRTGFSGTDLFINWHRYEEANFKIGQFIAPFGYEMLLPDVGPGPELLTAERSLATIAIVPERQVGAQLWGKPLAEIAPQAKDYLSYSVGAFNGNNRNTVANDNGKFMYVGRLESIPFKGKVFDQPVSWRIGANVLESDDNTGTLISQIGPLKLSTKDGSLSGYTMGSPGERIAWGFDQTLTVGRFDLTAEYIAEDVRPTTSHAAFSEFTAHGYYIQPSYYIWSDKLQLVAKYETFDPGQASHDTIKTITGGLNWYIWGHNVTAMLNYMHTWSDFRDVHPQDGKSEFDEILLRMQFYF